jgi:DNA-binding winged helix-turn-helix (wHTH) protein/tetratricopeptide (TPR) repeat protein
MTRSYCFSDFRLDPATRELHRGDAPVPVPPRAFDCIVYLVEQRERAVGRDELIAAVWGKTDVSDGLLGQAILAARRALEDTGKEQQFIRTVIRFGYHWIAAVDVIEATPLEPATADSAYAVSLPVPPSDSAAADASPQLAAASRPASRGLQRTAFVGIVAIALGLCAWLAVHSWRHADVVPAPLAASTHSRIVLVLPVTLSAGDGYAWVRLGLMDLIAERLRAAGLAVVPSDNVVALTSHGSDGATTADAAMLAQATGATLVIAAQAEAIAQQWRISLRSAYGEPHVLAVGEAVDVLTAARIATDRLARQLGHAPAADQGATVDPPELANLLQQVEAAILGDRLDNARALLAGISPAQRELPQVRLRLAQIDYQAGDFKAAEAGLAAVAQAVPAEQDPVLRARALVDLGVIAAMRDDTPPALRRFDEAIALLRDAHAPDVLGKALSARGNVEGVQGRYDATLRDFAEARAAFENAGSPLALAVLDSNLGALDMHRFRYAEAVPVFERAAQRFATFGVHAAELNALTAVAELKLALLDPHAARALEPRLHELIAQVADPARQRYGELTCAQILLANGRLQAATSSLNSILAAAKQADDRAAIARAHALKAGLALALGDARAAAEEAAAALQRYAAADDAHERARAFGIHVSALLADGQSAAATSSLSGLSRFAAHDGGAPARLYADLAGAEMASEPAAKIKAYELALADADALRIPIDLREVVQSYVGWLVRSGDLARAGAVAERIAAWVASDYESALLLLRVHHALGDENLWRGALARARVLAGERAIPAELLAPPASR